jgi:micrococcal nuclease
LEQLSALRSFPRCRRCAGGVLAVLTGLTLVLADSHAATRRAPTRRAAAQAPQCPTIGTQAVVFAKAVNGSTFSTPDGMQIRLAGVLAAGEDGETLSPDKAEAARGMLAAVLRSGPLTLAAVETKDRYGRLLAQVFANGAWVQGAMLRAGEMLVAPDRGSALCTKLLMAAEDEARSGRAGHWRDGSFALRAPEQLRGRAGRFEIVEGKVLTATVNKGRAYIDFGADYHTDFTVTVAPEDMKTFRQVRFDLTKLAGQTIRVRGWIELYNGPEIEIMMPGAIESLN